MNLKRFLDRFKAGLGLFTGALAIWVCILLLAYVINLIRAPFQLEYREGAMLQFTGALMQGINLYVANSQPMYMNMYGLGYHWLMTPLAALFGNTLWLHRLVSNLACLLAVIYLMRIERRKEAPWAMVLAGGALIFANQLFYTNPLARPDGLGFFCYVLAAFIPWQGDYSRKSLAISALLGILAFYTKSYFVAAAGYVGFYLLITRRWQALGEYVVFFGGGLAASVFLMNWAYPYYFYDTFLSQFLVGSRSLDFILNQSLLYVTNYAGVLLLLLGSAVAWFFYPRKDFSRAAGRRAPDFPAVGLILSILIIAAFMGWHRGTLMTYYFQFITPFLVVAFLEQMRRFPRLVDLGYLTLMIAMFANLLTLGINLADLGSNNPANLAHIPDLGTTDWGLIRARIASSQKIFDTPTISSDMISQGREIINNAHNEMFGVGLAKDLHFFLLPDPAEVLQRQQATLNQVSEDIRTQAYDWVVLTRDAWGVLTLNPFLSMDELETYYKKYDEVKVEMPQGRQTWTLEFWAPSP